MFEPTEINPDADTYETRKAYRLAQPKNVARALRSASKVALATAQRMEATERLSLTMDPDAHDALLKDLRNRTEYLVEQVLWALRTQELRGEGLGRLYKYPQSDETYWYER